MLRKKLERAKKMEKMENWDEVLNEEIKELKVGHMYFSSNQSELVVEVHRFCWLPIDEKKGSIDLSLQILCGNGTNDF